jgi:hypothetical protein
VIRSETRVNVAVYALHFVGIMAPVVSSGCWDFNPHLPQGSQRIQSAPLTYGHRIPSICEVVKGCNRILEKRILRRHSVAPVTVFESKRWRQENSIVRQQTKRSKQTPDRVSRPYFSMRSRSHSCRRISNIRECAATQNPTGNPGNQGQCLPPVRSRSSVRNKGIRLDGSTMGRACILGRPTNDRGSTGKIAC